MESVGTAMAENDIAQIPDVLPVQFQAPGVVGALVQMTNGRFRGWAYATDQATPLSLSLFDGDQCIATVLADQWRDDKAKLREGNGYCGFDLAVPEAICDGHLHEVDVRITDTGQS